MEKRGKIIAFEGLDCCGKDTQIDLLKSYFDKENVKYRYIPQLTTEVGQLTRRYLGGDVDHFIYKEKVHELMFAADRIQTAFEKDGILDSINEGYHVILNRFVISALVYALYDKWGDLGINESYYGYIKSINGPVFHQLYPDMTFYLKILPQESCRRLKERGSKQEFYENPTYSASLFKTFNEVINKEGGSSRGIITIDGSSDPISIHESILKYIKERMQTNEN